MILDSRLYGNDNVAVAATAKQESRIDPSASQGRGEEQNIPGVCVNRNIRYADTHASYRRDKLKAVSLCKIVAWYEKFGYFMQEAGEFVNCVPSVIRTT